MTKNPKWRGRRVYRNGQWEDAPASPELLREDLRALPSDFVTKEDDDPDRIHAEDPEHVYLSIRDDRIRDAKHADDKPAVDAEQLPCIGPSEYVDLATISKSRIQWEVDLVSMRVRKALLNSCMAGTEDMHGVWHLWWPEEKHGLRRGKREFNHYELREGPQPPDAEMPKPLRGVNVTITLDTVPERIRDALTERGHSFDAYDKLLEQMRKNVEAGDPDAITDDTYDADELADAQP